MRHQPGIAANRTESVAILFLSPLEDDPASLQGIVGHSGCKMFSANHLVAALDILQQHDISVVLCERDLMPGTWLDLLHHLTQLPHPPSLIVTSRLANDRLWAEALNLGAWDVLAKPFDRFEVLRSVEAAWQHWQDRHGVYRSRTRQRKAATGAEEMAATGT